MENFKQKLLAELERVQRSVNEYADYVNFIKYRVEKTKELIKGIRTEPTKLGIIKQPTTLEEIKVMTFNITGLSINNPRITDKAISDLIELKDTITEQLNILIEANKPKKNIKKAYSIRSRNNVLIAEVEKLEIG